MNAVGHLGPIRLETVLLRSKIIEAMRGAIEMGSLRPGERLVEKDLCETLGVSRTSLRELEAAGVVASAGPRGLTVVRITRRDTENVYAVRAEIEALVAAQFARLADAAELQELGDRSEALIAAYRKGAFLPIAEAKRSFTDHLCAVADNAVAQELLGWLTLRMAGAP